MRFDGTNWVYVGTPGFFSVASGSASFQDIAFHPTTKEPYISFVDDFATGREVTVMRFNGTNWVTVGPAGFSGVQASRTDNRFFTLLPINLMLPTIDIFLRGQDK